MTERRAPLPPLRVAVAAALAGWGCAARPPVLTKIVGGQIVQQRQIDPEAYEHAARAHLLEEEQRWEEAADELRRAIVFDDDSPELRARLAEALVRLDRLREAGKTADESLARGETPRGFIAKAHVAQAQGDTAAAVAALRRAAEVARVSIDPGDADETLVELAEAQVMALDVAGGAETLRGLCDGAPSAVAARVQLAGYAWALGDLREAERRLREALSIEPNQLEARLLLAWLHAATGQEAAARAGFREALDRSEGSLDLAAPFARYLMSLGRDEEARQLVDDLPIAEETEDTVLARVALERIVKRPQKAFAMIAAHHGPDATPELRARLDLAAAQLLEDAGKRKEATALLLAIPAGVPGYLEARLRAAALLRQEGGGHVAEAERALAEAQTAGGDEGEGEVEIALARALGDEKGNAPDRALARIDEALKKHPADPRLLLGKAATEERRGRWREALSLAAAILARDPGNVEALNFWGFVAVDRNHDPERATKHVRAALALEPGTGAILDSVGWALFRAGALPGATMFLEQAGRLEPDDPEVLSHLAQLYAQRGDRTRADALFRKALTLDVDDRVRKDVEARLRALTPSGPTP